MSFTNQGEWQLEKRFPSSKQQISELGVESCLRRNEILSGSNGRSQSRRQPNPVAFSENFYGFGIWFEFNFPLNDAWCELHNTYQYWFRFEVDCSRSSTHYPIDLNEHGVSLGFQEATGKAIFKNGGSFWARSRTFCHRPP